MSDDDFLTAFESCTLPFEMWTHRAHVRVAYLYASSCSLGDAIDRMRSGIRAYNQANQRPESLTQGYHETITQAFMRLVFVANRLRGPYRSAEAFCHSHPQLLERSALAAFYSKAQLMTAKAKSEFVPGDLAPLPVVIGDSTIILQATEGWQTEIARELFLQFAQSLDFDLCFQNFDAELAGLPGAYAQPRGRLLVGFDHSTPAGCVALRPLDHAGGEMKRLWVRPEFRGDGLGRRLAETIISEAKSIGYATMKLDTVASMAAAIALYRWLGFVPCQAYTDNPVAGAMFMELNLGR